MNTGDSASRSIYSCSAGSSCAGRQAGDAILAQSKTLALLAFLAMSPTSLFQRRDRIVGLLWPDLDQAHARAALRKTLHELRSALGAHVLSVARRRRNSACSRHRTLRRRRIRRGHRERQHIARALELYRGDFMPGFYLSGCVEFEHWVEDQRMLAREQAAAASWALAVTFEGDQRLTRSRHVGAPRRETCVER